MGKKMAAIFQPNIFLPFKNVATTLAYARFAELSLSADRCNSEFLQAWINFENSVFLQQNNSWATQLSRDMQSDIPFLCQNPEEAVFSLLDASFS